LVSKDSSRNDSSTTVKVEIQELEKEVTRLREQVELCTAASSRQTLQVAELIMENSNAILFRRLAATDPKDRKMVYVSPNISRFGYQAEDFINGKVMFRDLIYLKDSPRTLKEIRDFTNQGVETYSQFYRIVTKGGEVRWVEDRTSIYEDDANGLRYHQGIVIDVHDKKIIEEKLKKSEQKHRLIVETAAEGFILLDGSFKIVDLNLAFEELVGFSREELLCKQLEEIVVAYHKYSWCQDDKKVNSFTQKEFECELSKKNGQIIPVLVHSSPLLSEQGELFGVAVFITDMSSHKKALQLAAEVQKGLLPKGPPVVAGLDIAGTSMPCDEVGGDFYDYLTEAVEGQGLAVAVGDITGHGVDSALLMSSARGYLKVCASQPATPEDVVTSLNKHLVSDMNDSGRFMTLFYLCLRRDRNMLEWVRAGHDPALLYDPLQDSFVDLKGPGIALGVDPDVVFTTQSWSGVTCGQIIVLGTDGIWEASNDHGEMFGKERLKNIIRQRSKDSSEQILQEVISAHEHFMAQAIVQDDRTLIILKII
jgi:sigma-B regulation protein RsbU (phosphoserine phosphatase)